MTERKKKNLCFILSEIDPECWEKRVISFFKSVIKKLNLYIKNKNN